MSIECAICGKKPLKSAKLSFSHKHHVYRQNPNLQTVKINDNGTVKTVKVCTSCLKSGKVHRAV